MAGGSLAERCTAHQRASKHSRIFSTRFIRSWAGTALAQSHRQSEGRPSDLGEREPFYNHATTHCICAYHQRRLLELLPSKSFPDAEVLIVVRPNDTALHDHLQRAFAGMRAVKVIMERRAGDRRAAWSCPGSVDGELLSRSSPRPLRRGYRGSIPGDDRRS